MRKKMISLTWDHQVSYVSVKKQKKNQHRYLYKGTDSAAKL